MKVGEYYFRDDGGYPEKMWSIWHIDESLGDDFWGLTSYANVTTVKSRKWDKIIGSSIRVYEMKLISKDEAEKLIETIVPFDINI